MGGELNSNQQTNPKRQSTEDPNNLEKGTSVYCFKLHWLLVISRLTNT